MKKCNSALQTEKKLFQTEIDQICLKITKFLPFFVPKVPQNVWAFPLLINY